MAQDYMSDDFADYVTSDLHGFGPTGAPWTWWRRNNSIAGRYKSTGVLCQSGSHSGQRLYVPTEEIAGEVLGVGLTVPNVSFANSAQIAMRVADKSNYLAAQYSHLSGNWRVKEVIGGSTNVLGSGTVATNTTPYRFSCVMVGGTLSLYVGASLIASASTADPAVLLFGSYCGIYEESSWDTTNFNTRYDDVEVALPWLLSTIAYPAPDQSSNYVSGVAAKLNNRTRIDSLLGGRQSTILTSGMGLDDAVPTAKVHLIGRC